MHRTPLERWIAGKIGAVNGGLTQRSLVEYQLAKLRETVAWARAKSPFYAERLKGCSEDGLSSFEDFRRLPLTTSDDLRRHGLQFLCVSQGDINRVVTLETSGTSGAPKRVFFTAEDQELTIDFFRVGMSELADPGDSVLIALPCERAYSVGDLLATALSHNGVQPLRAGPIAEPLATIEFMRREPVDCVVGLPVQILSLVRSGVDAIDARGHFPRRVLLCSDHVPDSIVRAIRQAWNCEVFEHYGMTEMGLGGGVDCEAHCGYHLREADLYLEIVDEETGATVPPGEPGEIVFTTLTRRGMPFIRYRTGDISRVLPGRCDCGSTLQRIERVRARQGAQVPVGARGRITMATLDEALFAVSDLQRFTADIIPGSPATLRVVVAGSTKERALADKAYAALERVPAIRAASSYRELRVVVQVAPDGIPASTAKRRIAECAS